MYNYTHVEQKKKQQTTQYFTLFDDGRAQANRKIRERLYSTISWFSSTVLIFLQPADTYSEPLNALFTVFHEVSTSLCSVAVAVAVCYCYSHQQSNFFACVFCLFIFISVLYFIYKIHFQICCITISYDGKHILALQAFSFSLQFFNLSIALVKLFTGLFWQWFRFNYYDFEFNEFKLKVCNCALCDALSMYASYISTVSIWHINFMPNFFLIWV